MRPLALLSLLLPAPADAQEGGLDVQRFRPPPGPEGLLGVDSARIAPHLRPGVGLWLNHGSDPLVAHHPDGKVVPVVASQTALDLVAAVGLGDAVEAGLALPLSRVADQGFGAGDLRLAGKVRLLGDGVGDATALRAEVTLPTGDPDAFRGSGGVGGGAWYVPTWVAGPLDLSLNAGLSYRRSARLEALETGAELHVGAGAALSGLPGDLRASAELLASKGVSSADALLAGETMPVEVLAGARLPILDTLAVTAGLGVAVTEGYGTPSWRVVAGAYWLPRIERDADDDGILDAADACPEQPEDRDGVDDADGCPEDDVDGDGVADDVDKCLRSPEDRDGFEDGDGCPDVDNDGDKVADARDRCPDVPEDRDGFQDDDGCPDDDDDGDGVSDAADRCPAHKEDRDGFQDDDGCPDEDDDKDGFADADDKCPREAEVYNDVDDADGCPDGDAPSQVAVTDSEVEISEQIFFKFDTDEIKERSHPVLQQVGALLRAHPRIRTVLVEGHSDNLGSKALNRALSKQRAKTVRKYLIREARVPKERLVTEGFGELRPQATNETRKGRALNRRVQFLILEMDRTGVGPGVRPAAVPAPARTAPPEAGGPGAGTDDGGAEAGADDGTGDRRGKKARKGKRAGKGRKGKKGKKGK